MKLHGKKMTSPYPFVSILIPTRNNEKDLVDCLESIKALDYDLGRIEIIIWDNNSSAEGKEKIRSVLSDIERERMLQTEFIENTANYGVYTSRDELIKRISPDTEFVLSIDDDVILPSHLCNKLLPLFQRDSSIGIIGPRTVYGDSPSETAHGAGFINWWLGRYRTLDARRAVECDYVIGCCMLIKKCVIDEIGGFDRDYYTSHGEIDYCFRAKNKGYKVLYYPELRVKHRVERGGTRIPQRMYYVYRNKLFVIRKNAPLPQKWISLGLYSLFWLPKAILDSIIRNKRTDSQELKIIFRATMDGWLSKGGKRG
jgi:GT2 family glycosyltransferase